MINRNMRVMVMFDLPVASKSDKKHYAAFRKFLIKAGFDMLQFSIYTRITQNHDDAQKYALLVKRNMPPKGSVRLLQVTEKQYASMQVLLGEKTETENFLTPKDFIEI